MKVADLFKKGVIDSRYDKETNCVPTKAPKPHLATARVAAFEAAESAAPV